MKKIKKIFAISFILLAVMSCDKDDDERPEEFDGSLEAIENFFSADVLQAMRDLGFIFNEGKTPPIIEGEYLVSQLKLEGSNITNDNIGNIYNDIVVKLSNQLNEKLTIVYESVSGGTVDVGVESFISGTGNKFSVFIKVHSTRDENTSVRALAYSGTLLENGIENIQHTLIMLDDNGDPRDNLIENNTGRLFIDSDGLSPRQ